MVAKECLVVSSLPEPATPAQYINIGMAAMLVHVRYDHSLNSIRLAF